MTKEIGLEKPGICPPHSGSFDHSQNLTDIHQTSVRMPEMRNTKSSKKELGGVENLKEHEGKVRHVQVKVKVRPVQAKVKVRPVQVKVRPLQAKVKVRPVQVKVKGRPLQVKVRSVE